ncbi:MAG: hypothetical protein GAK31_02261 [Stenotrophomonas maltophilia]|uniref:UspA domain-containing protein n=1 Tax=Stenotrophomonas maltophilia TaxID=40324 RepID=A0A7V8FFZ2_STEMA|nr:MAG: hypothetical protein GAK31_02261 [Stenotrophomonas maltophilia]
MFQTILVAVDGDPQHDAVLALAAHVAGPCSRLHLLCVIDAEFALPADASPADRREYPAAARERRKADAVLDDALGELRERDVDAVAQVLGGEPADTISAQAGRLGADLIIIGHRHLGGLRRVFDSSVGQWTLDHASCPVLVETRAP